MDPLNTMSMLEELRHTRSVSENIDGFIGTITSGLNLRYSDSIEQHLKPVMDFIGFSDDTINQEIDRIAQL